MFRLRNGKIKFTKGNLRRASLELPNEDFT